MLEEGEMFHRTKSPFGVVTGPNVSSLFFLTGVYWSCLRIGKPAFPPLEAGENSSSNLLGDSRSRVVRETPLNPDVWPDAP